VKALSTLVLTFFVSFFSYSQEQKSLECVNRTYSIVVHIVKDKFGFTNYNLTNLNQAINRLNQEWKPICVNFSVCEIRYISNYNFDDWDETKLKTETLALFAEPKHINVFLVASSSPNDNGGFATQDGITFSSKDLIVLTKTATNIEWIHQFGHFFGLLNTYEPGEKVDGTNCNTSGDKICDTPADASGLFVIPTCIYEGNNKDVNNQYYKPLLENFMSNYGICRKSFTHQQYERMVNTLKINPSAKF
jgi:hypothetical protein